MEVYSVFKIPTFFSGIRMSQSAIATYKIGTTSHENAKLGSVSGNRNGESVRRSTSRGEETVYGRVPRKGKSHDQNQILILFYSRILIERLCVNHVNRVYINYMHHVVCIKKHRRWRVL